MLEVPCTSSSAWRPIFWPFGKPAFEETGFAQELGEGDVATSTSFFTLAVPRAAATATGSTLAHRSRREQLGRHRRRVDPKEAEARVALALFSKWLCFFLRRASPSY